MDANELYEIVVDAVKQGLAEELGGDALISKRMVEGRVVFEDGEGRMVREVPAAAFFKKVTAVREKLRVMEQKINNHPSLDSTDKAELQAQLTRCYGSLTTFNFLFQEERERFQGTGG